MEVCIEIYSWACEIVHRLKKGAYQLHSFGFRPALAFAVADGESNSRKQTRDQHANKNGGI